MARTKKSASAGAAAPVETPPPAPAPAPKGRAKAAAPAKGKAAPAPTPAPAPEEYSLEIRDAAMLMKQAGDPTRLRILLHLSEGDRNVGEICDELGGQSQPAVSHHLALLRHGRLIQSQRDGKNNVYSLTEQGRKLAKTVKVLVPSAQ